MLDQLQNALIEFTGRGPLLKRARLASACLEQIDDNDVPRAYLDRLATIRATLQFRANETAVSRNAGARRAAFDLIDLYTDCLGRPQREMRSVRT